MANYRSRRLLDSASEFPLCMGCGRHNDGSVVMAHSNQLRDGKGKGIKANDYRVAALCSVCHGWLDAGSAPRVDKVEFFESAHRKTVGWWFEAGVVGVKS